MSLANVPRRHYHTQQQQQTASRDATDELKTMALVPRTAHPGGLHLAPVGRMPVHLQHLVNALGGADHRAPLIYTGDVGSSLERLRADLHAHHAELSGALGEPFRPDYPSVPGLHLLDSAASPYAGHLPGPAGQVEAAAGGLAHLGSMIASSVPSVPSLGLAGAAYGGPSATAGLMPGPLSALQQAPGGVGAVGGAALLAQQWGAASPWLRGCGGASSASPLMQQPLGMHRYAPGSLPMIPPGARVSQFAIRHSHATEPDSLLASESSTFIYPPVGATFDGGRSRNILEGGARGSLFLSKPPPKIDSLADLQFRKGKPVQSFDALASQPFPGTAVRRLGGNGADTLDAFLADYVKGGVKPSVEAVAEASLGASLGAAGHLTHRAVDTQRLNSALRRFATSSA